MLIRREQRDSNVASAEQFKLFYRCFRDAPKYESAIRRMLLTPEERASYFAKFNMNALQRGDFKTRMEGYQVAINTEIMSPNEARELEDWNPYEGGDEYRTRTSTVRESPASDEGAQSDSGVER
jgi:phage portal protein BeeE